MKTHECLRNWRTCNVGAVVPISVVFVRGRTSRPGQHGQEAVQARLEEILQAQREFQLLPTSTTTTTTTTECTATQQHP